MAEERILRYAEPTLYKKMIEIFSFYHIHPYDIQATIKKEEKGYELLLKFPNHSTGIKTWLPYNYNQVFHFDEEARKFFEKAADACRSLLMAEYNKTTKP